MSYDKELISRKLRRWEKYLKNYSLPTWDEIPDFGLYMEQIIAILKEYLGYLPPDVQDGEVITAATINNYVRKKIMPQPIKKRYYREHIAYLIMICSLKHSLSINTISTMIPADLGPEELQETYTKYSDALQHASVLFIGATREVCGKILSHDDFDEHAVNDADELVVTAAVFSGFSRLLAEKLINLKDKKMSDIISSELY